MAYVFGAVEVVLLAAALVVGWFAAKGTDHRVANVVLLGAFAVVSFAASGVLLLVKINYRIPAAWIVAIVASVAALAGLVVVIGKRIGWGTSRIAALLVIFGIGSMGFFVLMYSDPGAVALRSLYEARASQMGDALGFTPLTSSTVEMPVDQLPISLLPNPEEGIAFVYGGFELHERNADAPATEAGLRDIVAPGSKPMSGISEVVPDDATITTLTVNGGPAVVAEFAHQSDGKGAVPAERATILVTVIDGVDVRLWSRGSEEYVEGQRQLLPAPKPSELAKIAETLRPVR